MRRILPLSLLALAPFIQAAEPQPAPAAPAPDATDKDFLEIDGDRDGFVTTDELVAHLIAKHAEGRTLTDEQHDAVKQIARALIADKDKNKDGRLTPAEYRAAGDDELTRMFNAADTNHDGFATLDEMRVSVRKALCGDTTPTEEQASTIEERAQQSLVLFDFDGDGRVSFLEMKRFAEAEASAPKSPDLSEAAVRQLLDEKPAFTAVDLDKNGYVTTTEITTWTRVQLRHAGPAYQKDFQQKGLRLVGFDADDNGKVTRSEWDAGTEVVETAEQRVDRLIEAFAALTFDDLDTDADGVVTEKEIGDATAKLAAGKPAADAAQLHLIAAMNLAKRRGEDGKITRASWIAATEKARLERLRERIEERFKQMDQNGDGFVVAGELVAYMRRDESEKPDEAKLKELNDGAAQYVGETDQNADNKISLAEYTEAVMAAQREQERREKLAETEAKLDAILEKHPLTKEETAGLTEKHKAMDIDGDGRVTLAEMQLFIKALAAKKKGAELSAEQNADAEKQCAAFMNALDADGDHAASLKEYLAGIAKQSADASK